MISRAVLFEQVVGRDAELERLSQLREQSALAGSVRLATICGDAGIGKSRLIAEFGKRSARVRNVFLHVRCEAEGSAPYAPIGDALEAIERSNPRSELARIALQVLRSTDTDDVSPEELVRRRLVRVGEAFVAEAKRCGQLTLILDDAHWSDVESLAALRFLARRSEAPLLIVVAYRPDDVTDVGRLSALASFEREGADRIVLGPLQEREQLQLLKATLPATPDGVLQRIVELAEGRPFFAEELARSAVDGRHASDVPLTLRAAILGRVADLSRDAREVLQRAAVLGPVFSYEDLAALCESEPDAIVDVLHDALKRQIVVEESAGSRIRFRFRHALTQAVFLGETLAFERRDLHRAMADRIEASGDTDRLDEVAYHRWASGDAAAATVACEAAGIAAMRVAAFNDAGRWFDRALEFSQDDGDFARLSHKRLDALIYAGSLDALTSHCRRMCARLEGTAYERDAALATCVSAVTFAGVHRVREAEVLLDSDVVRRTVLRDTEVRFEQRMASAWIIVRGRPGDVASIGLDAAQRDASELGLRAEARLMHLRQACLHFEQGSPGFAALTEKAAALASACGDYRLQTRIALNHAVIVASASLEQSIPLCRDAIAICESRGDYAATSQASGNLAASLTNTGKLAEAAELVRRAEARGLVDHFWISAQN